MKNSLLHTLLTLLLAAAILAAGWLGICALDWVLPAGTEEPLVLDMAALSEEPALPQAEEAARLTPFVGTEFPAGTRLLEEGSAEYWEAEALLQALLADAGPVEELVQSLAVASADTREQVGLWADDRGTWCLAAFDLYPADGRMFQVQVGLHSADGLRMLQLVHADSDAIRLTPDEALAQRAAEVCGAYLEYWTRALEESEAAVLPTEEAEDAGPFLAGVPFPTALPMPLAPLIPTDTELVSTQCRVYYPARGGQLVMIYDFIQMQITGMIFLPD